MLSSINNDIKCPRVSDMWGAMWWEATDSSAPLQVRQLQEPRRDFTYLLNEWRHKDDAAVRMQSCFRDRRVRRVAALRVPPEARDVVPRPPTDPLALSAPPSDSPSEPAASTAEARARRHPTP